MSNKLQAYHARVTSYEQQQKEKLVELGQGPKSWNDILAFLKAEIDMAGKMTDFNYGITCFRNDGVYQLNRAIEKIYGVSEARQQDKPSGGKENIQTVSVTLADGTTIKAPYGMIELPDLGKGAHIDIGYNSNSQILFIKGSCQFKFSSLIDEIVEFTKHLLNTDSVYKNQAIQLNSNYEPEIMNLQNIGKEFMVLTDKTEQELIPLMSRVKNAKECVAKGIPLKTGILFEGPYGTGKTLAAFKIAAEAIQNNWAFIYLKDPSLLAKTLLLSKTLDKNGNGVIVFLEDVDQVTAGGRDEALQNILNTLDGGDTKNMNVIALFTTNHIENINPTFMRGKRIGSIVSFGALDSETAMKFLEFTFDAPNYELANKKGAELNELKAVCDLIGEANIVPAFMAEITEKVKSILVFTNSKKVTASAIKNSLESYKRQVELSQQKDVGDTPDKRFVNAFREVFQVDKQLSLLDDIHAATA